MLVNSHLDVLDKFAVVLLLGIVHEVLVVLIIGKLLLGGVLNEKGGGSFKMPSLITPVYLARTSYKDASKHPADNVSTWRLEDIGLLSQDEDHGGNEHEHCWNSEGQRVTALVAEAVDVLAEDGSEEGGDHRAGVDGEVEDGEEGLELPLLFRELELVTAERGDAGLDASGADGDQEQAEEGKLTIRRLGSLD